MLQLLVELGQRDGPLLGRHERLAVKALRASGGSACRGSVGAEIEIRVKPERDESLGVSWTGAHLQAQNRRLLFQEAREEPP